MAHKCKPGRRGGKCHTCAQREWKSRQTPEWHKRNKAQQAGFREKNRQQYSDYQLEKKYGITRNEYESMLASQGGGCAICGRERNKSGRALPVDHDHETGNVRGILCQGCNNGLGCFEDNQDRLRRAIAYLKERQ